MKLDELALKCVESINACTLNGLKMEDAKILVTTPQGWRAPPKFPRSEIVQWREDGTRVRYLPAARTLAWLAANGAVKLVFGEGSPVPK